MYRNIFGCIAIIALLSSASCGNNEGSKSSKGASLPADHKYKVTFIELGSVNCVPCQMMQPVMKKVVEKYPTQVRIVFYDVWTEEGAPYAKIYNIRAIPTQVFLDENNREYFRHEGFFQFEELEKILQQKGVL